MFLTKIVLNAAAAGWLVIAGRFSGKSKARALHSRERKVGYGDLAEFKESSQTHGIRVLSGRKRGDSSAGAS